MSAHGFFFVLPVLGPLGLWLIMRRRSDWVAAHAAHAFEFQATYFLFFLALVPISIYQSHEAETRDFAGSGLLDFVLGLAVPLAVAVWIIGLLQAAYRISDARGDALVPYRWSLRLLRRRL